VPATWVGLRIEQEKARLRDAEEFREKMQTFWRELGDQMEADIHEFNRAFDVRQPYGVRMDRNVPGSICVVRRTQHGEATVTAMLDPEGHSVKVEYSDGMFKTTRLDVVSITEAGGVVIENVEPVNILQIVSQRILEPILFPHFVANARLNL
jgi:hypothetical protein